MPAAGVVPRQCTRHQVANLQESEVVQKILVGHPVVEGLVLEPVSDTPTPIEPTHRRHRWEGGRDDEGTGCGGRRESTPSGTDQNSPSSFLFSSCFWMSGDTSSHSLALEQSQAAEREPHRVRRHLFLPRRLLSPECLLTGGSGLDREPRGVGLSLACQPVPLWHCLACRSAVRSARPMRVLVRGTYLSLQAPFHSIQPQGFRTRIRVSVLPL